tara:strand:+ start:264 stop:797 length:534 start_codon:yes stop_codon:yes gene_type:complete
MSTHPFITGLAIYGCYESLRKVGLVKDIDCPAPVKDEALNRKNKVSAAKEHFYGPDPFARALTKTVGTVKKLPVLAPAGHPEYWMGKAQRKQIPVEVAMKQLCGNCKAFNITPPMVACGGASERPILVECAKGGPPRLTTPVGYCEMHEFKCSALRSCDTWVGGGPKGGGPITEYTK